MRIRPADEADTNWIGFDPTFRIILFEGPIGSGFPDNIPSGYNTEVIDVDDADVTDVLQLATELAGSSMEFAIALILEGPDYPEGRGKVWISGTDLNYDPEQFTAAEQNRRRISANRVRSTDEVASALRERILAGEFD